MISRIVEKGFTKSDLGLNSDMIKIQNVTSRSQNMMFLSYLGAKCILLL